MRGQELRRLALLSISSVLTLALISDGVRPIFAQNHKTGDNKTQNNVDQRQGEKTGSTSVVARGKYLVEDVAMCGTCHTPLDASGRPDRSRWLQGAPVPYLPAQPSSDWPICAPRIGGTPPADDADMVKLLMTGVWTSGNHLRTPMPQFRMDRNDAEAVVAYLKSVMPQQ
jgi:mono/diheme cytochrome c family protein